MKKFKGYVLLVITAGIFCTAVTAHSQPAAPLPVSASPILHKHEYMLRSGVAFDASEDILGLIHIQEPKNFFKPDTEQVTWWGEFKPFKAWGRPELEAYWYNPKGELVSKQQFKGSVCRLAKATLKMQGQNTQENQGRWQVEVFTEGKLIDRKNFFISDASYKPPQTVNFPGVTVEAQSRDGGISF